MKITTIAVLVSSAAVLAGCATQGSAPGAAASSGTHLVYRDANGAVIRQFDYPTEDLCRRVENIAGRGARCQTDSAGTSMPAQATLRYNPPGVLVRAHYADIGRCRTETGQLGPGVELINACAPK